MEILWAIWVFMFGACVGSFLNVVVWRLPRGQSICYPGSYCPACGKAIAGHDNIPIFSWFFLGGKCRSCKSAISIKYPVVEFATAASVTLLYVCYYIIHLRRGAGDFSESWPMFVAHAVLLCGLLACSLIDVEHWMVPLEVCWVVSIIGAISAAAWPPPGQFMPPVDAKTGAICVAAAIGLVVSLYLQHKRVFLPSFIDAGGRPFRPRKRYMSKGDDRLALFAAEASSSSNSAGSSAAVIPALAEQISSTGEANLTLTQSADVTAAAPQASQPAGRKDYSAYKVAATEACGVSPRLEILREILFLVPAFALAAAAWWALDEFPAMAKFWSEHVGANSHWEPARHFNALLASLTGFLVGGLWIWAIRILGTLAFNKEAMGLGDVHVMAAVGAVTGWIVPSMVFFLAPILGLAWALFMWFSKGRRELPYGPWIAAATFLILLFYDRVAVFLKDYAGVFGLFRSAY